jgi:hypothetical protein
MSDAELKQYFLKHQGDQTAFQAYLDRLNHRPRKIIASPSDPDFDEKVQAAIRQKLELAGNGAVKKLTSDALLTNHFSIKPTAFIQHAARHAYLELEHVRHALL